MWVLQAIVDDFAAMPSTSHNLHLKYDLLKVLCDKDNRVKHILLKSLLPWLDQKKVLRLQEEQPDAQKRGDLRL